MGIQWFVENNPLAILVRLSVSRLQASIDAGFAILGAKMSQLDDDIADLSSRISHLTSVDASAVTLINGFSDRLKQAVDEAVSAGAPPTTLQALVDLGTSIDASAGTLAAAVAANTPAAPATPDEPPAPTDTPPAPDAPPATP